MKKKIIRGDELTFYEIGDKVGSYPKIYSTPWDNDLKNEKEHKRLSWILEHLKHIGIINSFKDFASKIGESSVGLNDLKKGRKKISVRHIKNMNISYPFINTDYIVFGEDHPFTEEFLIQNIDLEGNILSYDLDIEKAMKLDSPEENEIEQDIKNSSNKKYIQIANELIKTKNELLDAKDEILKMKDEIYGLRLKLIHYEKRK